VCWLPRTNFWKLLETFAQTKNNHAGRLGPNGGSSSRPFCSEANRSSSTTAGATLLPQPRSFQLPVPVPPFMVVSSCLQSVDECCDWNI